MATLDALLDRVTWDITAYMSMDSIADPEAVYQDQLVPFRLAVYDVDEFRMDGGWPEAVPSLDVHTHALVSAAGEIVEFRPDPTAVTTQADVRWIASSDFYNTITGRWAPAASVYGDAAWQTAADFAPVMIEETSYRIGKRILFRDAIQFNQTSHDHFWSDFTPALRNLQGYTVILVASLRASSNTVEGTVEYSGLLSPGTTTPPLIGGNTFTEAAPSGAASLQIRNGKLCVSTTPGAEFQTGPSISSFLSSSAPVYLVYSVGAPHVRVTVGSGPTSMSTTTFVYPTPQVQNLNVVLGRTTGNVDHCASMLLYDVGLYADQLTDAEITAEIAALSASYGGS